VPTPGSIDTTGLDMSQEQVAKALAVNVDEWRDKELPLIEEWFAKFGDTLPTQLADELATLKARLESA
jgi:phosphoenolpyruvate carboxykinase (GTP)